jgi:hypothetical protein
MAVVQISRIQVRRGQKNAGSGLPQLASGELGWAVDTRELYIGNGAVSEGAPAVGNTKILTEFDNIFSLTEAYTYRTDDAYIVTGGDVSTPIVRSLQARLDDTVSGRSFGLTGQTSQIATAKLQTAIDQLYLNSATKGSAQSKIVLHLEAGEYIVDDTIYIPPYATIVGAGSGKTIIRTSTASTTIFKTVNSNSTPGAPATDASTTSVNQATDIRLEGVTLETTVPNKGLILENCKDSMFRDVEVTGPWVSGNAVALTDVGIEMNSLSGTVETKNNIFENCKVSGYSYGISSDWDIHNNMWDNCSFTSCSYGFAFATNLNTLNALAGSGQEKGPNRHAIWSKFGTLNSSSNNSYVKVGTEGAAEFQATHSVIKYEKPGNSSNGDYFARTAVLSYTPGYWISYPYLPEIEGAVIAEFGETHTLNTILRTGTDANGPIGVKRFRLSGEPDIASQQYEIEYVINSSAYSASRSGTCTLTLNGIDKTVTVSDNYDYIGTSAYEDAISFGALIQDADGDTVDETVDVLIASTMPSDDQSTIEFKIRNRKSTIDAAGE